MSISGIESATLSDVMRATPITIAGQSSLRDAVNLMSHHGIRHLVVVSPGDNVIGLLSQRDVFRFLSNHGDPKALVRDVMAMPVVTASPEMLVTAAAKLLIENRIGCLPIVSAAKRLVGLVTRSDLLSHVYG